MALKKNAHQMFTDREEPRQAFWNTLRRLEENPGSSQIITYYGEGGIGKSWLLQDIKRRLERMDPETDQSVFSDGFVFRGEYVPVFYNLETSTDIIEMLCQIRYTLFQLKEDLAFPLFDCAIKQYKDITGKNLASTEGGSDSFLAKYEKYLDTAAMFIPGLGTLQSLYGYVKKGGSFLNSTLAKIEDRRLRSLYSEYFDAINSSETADDIRDNIAEFFKTDLNIAERDCSIIFFIDTFELLAYNTGINTHSWLTEELARETSNTLWVFAGRNKIYSEFENEHLLGDLSEDDTKYYLRVKAGISDEEVVQRIYEISHGTPIFLDICVQNYRNEGNPPAEKFRNLNKEQLLNRYVKYLSDGERLVIRLMASMSHWTDNDYREIFNSVHNGSFSQYHESYNKVVRSTMIEKDNEDRYFLHRAVRTGIYEDPDYPEEIKNTSRDEMLELYRKRAKAFINPVYYASRIAELIETIANEKTVLSNKQIATLAYAMIELTLDLNSKGENSVAWYYDLVKDHIKDIAHTELAEAYISLFLADLALACGEFETAYSESQNTERIFSKYEQKRSRSTIFARRIRAYCLLKKGLLNESAELLESCINDYNELYPDGDLDCDNTIAGASQILMYLNLQLNRTDVDYGKALEDDIAAYGWDNGMTILSAMNYANSLRQKGKFAEAVPVFEKAIQHCDSADEEDSEMKLQLLNSLSLCCYEAGQKEKAVNLTEKSYTLCQEKENWNKYISIAAFNLGCYAMDDGKCEEANNWFNKSLAGITEAVAVINNEEIGTMIRKIGDLKRTSGDYKNAYQNYCKACEIFKINMDAGNPLVLSCVCLQDICRLYSGISKEELHAFEDHLEQLIAAVNSSPQPALAINVQLKAVLENRNLPASAARQLCLKLEEYYLNAMNDQKTADDFARKAAMIRTENTAAVQNN